MTTLPREIQARILSDLAKGYRSTVEIARIHQVTTGTVQALRSAYGGDVRRLTEAAEEMRRPIHAPAAREQIAELVAEAMPTRPKPRRGGYSDGLLIAERHVAKRWLASLGEPVPLKMLPREALERWEAAGRPDAPPEPAEDLDAAVAAVQDEPDLAEDAPDLDAATASDPETPAPGIGGEADPAPDPWDPPDAEPDHETPVTLESWLGYVRQQAELTPWTQAVDAALRDLSEAATSVAVDAQRAIVEAEQQLQAAREAAARLMPIERMWTP